MTSTSVRPKTHVTDKGAVRYIVAAIGHRRLDQLTPADVRAVRTAVTDDGLSTSTALRYHGTLMRMLKKARDEGHDVAARVLAVRPPTKAVSDRRAIPLPDSLALLSVAAELGHGSRWVAALLQGMRQGECLGLTWEQVDLDAGSLTISWQLQALNYRDKSNRRAGFLIPDGYEVRQLEGRMHLVRPKSDAGWRVIPLVPWMVASLEAWRTAQAQNTHPRRSEAAYNLVWPALDGSPADAVEDRDEWRTMQDTVGVRHPGGRHYTSTRRGTRPRRCCSSSASRSRCGSRSWATRRSRPPQPTSTSTRRWPARRWAAWPSGYSSRWARPRSAADAPAPDSPGPGPTPRSA
jgi:hypothetical protein